MSPTKKPKYGPTNTDPKGSGSTPSSPEVLIPSLPNDVALNILARVPRQYHAVLCAVSKPVRTAISSPEFFSLRSRLNCTEALLYLRLRSPSRRPADWFVAHGRTPSQNPSNEQSNLILVPVPSIPIPSLDFSSCAVFGPKIYVLGGLTDFGVYSDAVWVLDCRFHSWERGPSMRSPRIRSRTAVLDSKICVIGGLRGEEGLYAEVLDPVVGRWEAILSPPKTYCRMAIQDCLAVGGVIQLLLCSSSWEELRFDPRTQTWEVISSPSVGFGQKCVVDGTLYKYDSRSGALARFDEKLQNWKELEVATEELPKSNTGIRMTKVGGRLAVLMFLTDENYEERILEMWSGEIKRKKNGDYGEVVCWEKVFSRLQSDFHVPKFIYSFYFPIIFNDCDCLSVSL